MRKPYIKLYKEVDGFKVYIVDGTQVRKSNKEFTDYGQHYDYPNMIPPDELWLDKGHGHQEYKHCIFNMITQNNFVQQGATYEEANRMATRKGLRYTEVSIVIKKKLLTNVDGVGIWLVDGKAVRDRYDVDFGQGGHDLICVWIPTHEIWIDENVPFDERDKVIEGQLSERGKMSSGMKYIPTYREAPIEDNGRKKRGFRRFHLPRPKRPRIRGIRGRRRR